MPVLVPLAAAKPVVALVVLLSQRYVKVLFPPLGVEPVSVAGVEPAHISAGVLMVLDAITGFTVTVIAELVIEGQIPALTTLLYQVVAVKLPGL